MVKVYVAQTHQKYRDLVGDFLVRAGHDVELFGTDANSLVRVSREMLFKAEPFALVTSQRDIAGCPFISNLLHATAKNLSPRTLTIVYSRAVIHQDDIPGVFNYLADLEGTEKHSVRMVGKEAENTRDAELGYILSYLREFAPNK